MKLGLEVGLTGVHRHVVAVSETARHLFRNSPTISTIPEVFATAHMVGLMEWGCVELIAPFHEPGEGCVGTHVDVSHVSATPPGMTATVSSRVAAINDKSLWFEVSARDGVDEIDCGRHQRAVVNFDRFAPKAAAKLQALGREQG